MEWFSKNFWLKIVALVLAVIVWAYAREDLNNSLRYEPGAVRTQEPSVLPQK